MTVRPVAVLGFVVAVAVASAGVMSVGAGSNATGTESAGNSAVLVAIDELTGRTTWTASGVGSPRYFSDAHEARGVVFVEEWECDPFGAPNGPLRGAHREAFVAFDAETGDELWRKRASRIGGHDSRGVAGAGTPFVVTQNGRLQGIDPRTGTVVWSRELSGREMIAGNTDIVLLGPRRSADGFAKAGAAAVAVDRRNGETRWTDRAAADGDVPLYGGVVGAEQVLTEEDVGARGSIIRVLDHENGRELQQLEVGPSYGGLALGKSTLAFGGYDGVRGYDTVTGALRWHVPGRAGVSGASPRGPFLVVPEDGTHTVALDPKTGSVVWMASVVPGFGSNRSSVLASTPIYHRGGSAELVPPLPTDAGVHEFVLLDATTGAERWRRPRGPVDEWAPREEHKAGLVGATNVYLYGGCQWSS